MSRAEWILGGILVVLLAIVLIAAAFLWLPDRTPQVGITPTVVAVVAPTIPFAGSTAVFAFAEAATSARNWQGDASLLEMTATWPQGVTRENILTGSTVWGFTFYSPALNEVAYIEVVDNQARLITQTPAPTPLSPMDSSGWQVDSPEAIRILLEEAGGDEFLRTQGVSILTMNLNLVGQSGRIEWLLSLFSSQTGQSLVVRVDANSGELIPLTPS